MITSIAGIPCQAQLTHLSGGYVPARVNADPDSCYEAEYPEVDFEILDRKGYRAKWLETKLTPAESDRIETELLKEMEDEI